MLRCLLALALGYSFWHAVPSPRCVANGPNWTRPIRVDIGMQTGRRDTATPGWHEWQIADGATATEEFGNIRVTLRAVAKKNGAALLKGAWDKAGLARGATMATDGVLVEGGDLEIQIEGLPPGPHTLVTYHNAFDTKVEGDYKLQNGGDFQGVKSGATVTPTYQADANADVRAAFVTFETSGAEPAILRIVRGDSPVVLNGLAIDAADPNRQASRPLPADGDNHVAVDDAELQLQWQPTDSAVKHEVYFTSAATPEAAFDAVASARPGAAAHVSTVAAARLPIFLDRPASLLYCAWRIDSVDAAGHVTHGDVWTFRPRQLAFPGAEGYGRFAIGGRGGRVIKVTNLDDSGPGSLRAAVEAEGPRTVVFDVGGKIVLKNKLVVRNPYLTIAGQTAPGKGICIANYNLGLLGAHDVVIRFVRVRPGDTSGDTLDGMGMASTDHSIFDHCSISWTQDESFSSRGARNITLQRTLISEALNIANHKKYEKGKQHGYAASIGGDIGSFHHNLLAHCSGRNWSLAGGLDQASRHAGRLDIRNNLVYNWGHRTTDGGARQVNFVNNYYKPGPASDVFHVLMAEREAVPSFGPQEYFVAGNVMEGRFGADETLAGVFERRGEPHKNFIVAEPFFDSFVTTQTAEEARDDILADVGCNVPALDEHDRRVIEEVRNGTTTFVGSRSGLKGLPDSQEDVGGWDEYPEIRRGADWDSDGDGIPNAWEESHGLNPNSPAGDFADANGDRDGDGFTNLEDYLNCVVEDAAAERLEVSERPASDLAPDETYLFTSFRDNGEDGLHFLTSDDGCRWTEIPGAFLKPAVGKHRLMRDPSLACAVDGTYHLVWTTGWKDDQGFGHASSKDLIHWSEQQFVPAMAHEPTTVNVWAPELFYDEPRDQFIICWASTIPGKFPDNGEPHDNNQRMYYTTTRDFNEFAPTRLFCDPGFSVIDATIVRDGDRFVLVLKNNSRQGHQLYTAVGDSPLGPWRDVTGPFTDHFTEGPSVMRIGDDWLVYFDAYRKAIYGAAKTRDFKTFADATAQVSFPPGHKHGTVLVVPRQIVAGLQAAAK